MRWIWPLDSSLGAMPSLCIAVSLPSFELPCGCLTRVVVEALRTILFGTHSWIGLDFGILFAWIGLSIILYPFAAFVMRWKMKRGL